MDRGKDRGKTDVGIERWIEGWRDREIDRGKNRW
jgi:hypothetical protein